jgi:hypothetical protein
MSDKPTGGDAFPTTDGCGQIFAGMTLRDYFAAKALPAVHAEFYAGIRGNEYMRPDDCRKAIAQEAYLLADAMIKAREL